ncbi:hypothetical protein T05_9751 [Trichinella murrelli]|uniref:Uncharacterized protein n=1 Tax=Trichinella murrelli TaxID=144512 RepID=A0A0V0T009_9BILA|nr:hypothetical protein T05_9751 [Trichinella murrelli]
MAGEDFLLWQSIEAYIGIRYGFNKSCPGCVPQACDHALDPAQPNDQLSTAFPFQVSSFLLSLVQRLRLSFIYPCLEL